MTTSRILAGLAVLLAAGTAHAGPPRGGFLPGGFGQNRGGSLPGMNLPFKTPGTLGLGQRPTLPGSPIPIPQGPNLPNRFSQGQPLPGNGPVPGPPRGKGIFIASQIVQGLVSQLGAGGLAGGGGGDAGYADPGYSDSGSAAACPAPAPITTDAAPAEPAPAPGPTGNTTALRIDELVRGGAARAGLQPGDIILRVDGQRTKTIAELQAILAASSGKAMVQFVNSDNGNVETREVAVIDRKLGVALTEIPVQLEEDPVPMPAPVEVSKPAGETALQVTEVRPGHARDAGIQVHDVVLRIDGQKVASGTDIVAAFKASKGTSEVELFRTSEQKVQTVTMKVEEGKIGLGVKVVPVDLR